MVSSTSATLSRAGPPCVLGEVSVSHLSLSSVPWDIFTQATCLSSSWRWFSGWHNIFSFPVWRFLICSVFFCHKSIYIKKLEDTKPMTVKLLALEKNTWTSQGACQFSSCWNIYSGVSFTCFPSSWHRTATQRCLGAVQPPLLVCTCFFMPLSVPENDFKHMGLASATYLPHR